MKPRFPAFAGAVCLLAAASFVGCTSEPLDAPDSASAPQSTRAYGDKTPKLSVIIECNDTNPLNAGSYTLSSDKALFDVVELYAAGIRKRTAAGGVEPALYLNDNLAALLEPHPVAPATTGWHKYVKPLQDRGIRVLLTILGDHQGIGVSNMTDTQAQQFARILAHTLERYQLDGISFDDEYAGYPSTVSTSFSRIITHLRSLAPGKLIHVLDFGNTYRLDASARACIDCAYPVPSSVCGFAATPGLGLSNDRWAPMGVTLSKLHTPAELGCIRTNSHRTAVDGYGAIRTYDLRIASDRNPLAVLQAIATGAYNETVRYDGKAYSKDWAPSAGLLITVADAE